MSKFMKSKISIVTVCYNAEKTIESTIQSVLMQTYRPIEYIIVDGFSQDRTIYIINKYSKLMIERGIEFVLISERDTGIYNAMNKGISKATGEWIAFMNADDRYTTCDVIENTLSLWNKNSVVIYGNEFIKNNENIRLNIRNDNIDSIKKNLPFCHQSTFTRTAVMKKYKFNESYKIAADYNFFLSLYLNGEGFQYINNDICIYNENGASAVNYKQAIRETYNIKITKGICKKNIYYHLKKEIWIILTSLKIKNRLDC